MKSEITFFARVLPERASLTVDIPGCSLTFAGFNLELELSKLSITNNQATIRATVIAGARDVFLIRNLVSDHIRSALDFTGYLLGVYFDLDITSAIVDGNKKIDFEIGIPVLQQAHAAAPGRRKIEEKPFMTAILDPSAKLALSDFRKAMTDPLGTGFYCYRAIEALKQAIAPSKEAVAWQKFRETLNIDRGAIDFVKGHADDRRHGRSADITNAQRAKIFLITDKILGRYLEYLSRENCSLPTTDFPIIRDSDFDQR